MIQLPTDFEALARQPIKPGGGSPAQISASGLMKNFVYAALDSDQSWVESGSGQGGYEGRRLKLPAIPSGGTWVLGCVDGEVKWLETQDC
jgi:hypothetical protein